MIQEKSGWLSVYTPAISSRYSPVSSIKERCQVWPKPPLPQVKNFLPGEMPASARCDDARAGFVVVTAKEFVFGWGGEE